MNKAQLNQTLDNYFKDLQKANFKDLQARISSASQYLDFNKNETELRNTEVQLAKAKAYNEDTALLQKQCDTLNATRNQLIKKYALDLNMHYVCSACHDSGFLNNLPCVCRQKKYVQILKENCSASRLGNFTFADNKIAEMEVVKSKNNIANFVNQQTDKVPNQPTKNETFVNDSLSANIITYYKEQPKQAKIFLSLYDIMQKVCDKFDTTSMQCFLIMGEVGIGKSSLATATANELLNKGKTVLYFTAFEINSIFLKHHLANVALEDIAFDSLFNCDFLIIDDLGTEPIYNNVSMQYLFSTIDTRILNKKKTMVCTNLSAEKFIQKYGERALSRLTDKRYALRLDYLSGDDLRKIKK